MTRPVFIAEVSSNHHGNLDRCLQFVDTAASAGCGAVKFQLFRIDELFAPEILEKSPLHQARREWELPPDFLPPLARRCREKSIEFSCTPFYIDAVEQLLPHVDFFKIASYELLWTDLLSACGRTGKPVVLSTGMATMDEIEGAAATLRNAGCKDLTLLHCVSGYPAPAEECNLAAIRTLGDAFHCKTGWSDHSVSPAVIHRAVHRWDAEVIEFHLDLDGEGEEFAAGHCWLPGQIASVIKDIRTAFAADGNGQKLPTPAELPDRDWRADPVDGLRPLKLIRETWNA
jgi:N-acetylneuraminate synthase